VVGWVDWNMVLDTQGGPNWKKNFVDAPLLVDPVKKEYYRQPSYYAMAHFSKFLPPGSYRVDTPLVNSNNNHGVVGGFRTPNGSTVVIAINTEGIEIDLIVEDDKEGKLIEKIAPRSVQTYVYYD
jgi:glucosylceramidase